jgi:hypothetical protein
LVRARSIGLALKSPKLIQIKSPSLSFSARGFPLHRYSQDGSSEALRIPVIGSRDVVLPDGLRSTRKKLLTESAHTGSG